MCIRDRAIGMEGLCYGNYLPVNGTDQIAVPGQDSNAVSYDFL